jgi:hypothetical protein
MRRTTEKDQTGWGRLMIAMPQSTTCKYSFAPLSHSVQVASDFGSGYKWIPTVDMKCVKQVETRSQPVKQIKEEKYLIRDMKLRDTLTVNIGLMTVEQQECLWIKHSLTNMN